MAATASLKRTRRPSQGKPPRRRATELRPRLDLALLIDTTGAMGTYVRELRRGFIELIHELRTATLEPRLGLIAYKDHGAEGEEDHYLTRCHALAPQLSIAQDFIKDRSLAPGRGGGGAEALECALHAANKLDWRPDARRLVVAIGDKPPHGGGLDDFRACTRGVDYRAEVEALRRAEIGLTTIQVGNLLETRRVYEWMAAETGGASITLTRPVDLTRALTAIVHRACGDLARYHRRLRERGALSDAQRRLLRPLSA